MAAFDPLIPTTSSEDTLRILQERREQPITGLGERIYAQYIQDISGGNLTLAAYDALTSEEDQRQLTASEADELYPIGNPREQPVGERDAQIAHERYVTTINAQKILDGRATYAGAPVIDFLTGIGAAMAADPLLMGLGYVGGAYFADSKYSSRLTASIYNTLTNKASNALAARIAIGGTEAIGSLLVDIPLESGLGIIEAHNPRAAQKYTVEQAGMNILAGMLFSGVIGGVTAGKEARSKVMTDAASMRHIIDKTSAYVAGVHLKEPTDVIKYFDEQGLALIRDIKEQGVYGVNERTGVTYDTVEALTRSRNLEEITFIRDADTPRVKVVDAEEFTLKFAENNGYDKQLILEGIETAGSLGNFIHEALADSEVANFATGLINAVKKEFGDDVIFGNYKIGKGLEGAEKVSTRNNGVEENQPKEQEANISRDLHALQQEREFLVGDFDIKTLPNKTTVGQTPHLREQLGLRDMLDRLREHHTQAEHNMLNVNGRAVPLYAYEFQAEPSRVDITNAFKEAPEALETTIDIFANEKDVYEIHRINLEAAAYYWEKARNKLAKAEGGTKLNINRKIERAAIERTRFDPYTIATKDLSIGEDKLDKIFRKLEKDATLEKRFPEYRKLFSLCREK